VNAVITFGLTLREYNHEQTINLKLAFHVSSVRVRVAWASFCYRVNSCLVTNTKEKSPFKFAMVQPWVSMRAK